jgi:hypothetical protein
MHGRASRSRVFLIDPALESCVGLLFEGRSNSSELELYRPYRLALQGWLVGAVAFGVQVEIDALLSYVQE